MLRRSNQSILKEISPEYSLEGLMLKVETPILWLSNEKNWLIGKDWFWERLKAGGKGDDGGWDGWMALHTKWTWVWAGSESWWWTGKPGMLYAVHEFAKSWIWLSDWTELIIKNKSEPSIQLKSKFPVNLFLSLPLLGKP